MFRASVDDFMGYAHHAYAETEEEARELLATYILTMTTVLLSTVDEAAEFFGIRVEPVVEGVFCESDPEMDLSGVIDPTP